MTSNGACLLLRCVLALLVLLAPAAAAAQSCSWSVSGIAFGSVDTLAGTNNDTTATVSINCSGFLNLLVLGNLVRVCPNLGFGTGGVTESNRQMLSGSNALSYQLYSDTWGGTTWGSNVFAPDPPSPPTLTVTLNVLGSGSLSPTLFARVFGGQSTVAPGPYQSNYSGTQAQLFYRQCSSLLSCPPCSTALEGSSTTSFAVAATVPSNCLVSATNLNFGSAGVLNTNVDGTNAVSITCTNGTPWSASLNAGSGSGGTVNLRRMTGPGGATIAYTIYLNAARSQVWGDGSSGTLTLAGTGTGNAQSQTGYGRVPPQATPAPATYTDTVVVTLTY